MEDIGHDIPKEMLYEYSKKFIEKYI